MAPPITFGATWRAVGIHRRYGVDRFLWICPEAPPAFSDAYRNARGPMVAAGYSWTDRGTEHGVLTPCFWGGGDPVDLDALRAEVDRVVAAGAATRAERARIEQERLDAEAARLAPLAAPIRAELSCIVAERPWLLGPHLTAARELLAVEVWSIHGIQDAERHLRNAMGNAERAAERLAKIPPRVWFGKAADPAVQTAALQACL